MKSRGSFRVVYSRLYLIMQTLTLNWDQENLFFSSVKTFVFTWNRVIKHFPFSRILFSCDCFWSDSFFFFFGRNDCIFHCLDIPKNWPNLEDKSHLAKIFIIYCRPEFPPLGGAVIKHSAFWLITPIYFVAHSNSLYPRVQWSGLSLVV